MSLITMRQREHAESHGANTGPDAVRRNLLHGRKLKKQALAKLITREAKLSSLPPAQRAIQARACQVEREQLTRGIANLETVIRETNRDFRANGYSALCIEPGE